jgi:hypothetical protein
MNPVFAKSAFWLPYLTLEAGEVGEDEFVAQLEELRRDFVIRDDIIKYQHGGRQHTAVRRVVEFPFSCGQRYSLLIEYEPGVDGCSKNLFLVDARSGKKSEMGWWDLARWHPYCLRPEEFDRLLEFWRRRDPRWQGQDLPLPLLCQFVGLPNSADRDALADQANAAVRALGLPRVGRRQLKVPLHVPEGDCRWEVDATLG